MIWKVQGIGEGLNEKEMTIEHAEKELKTKEENIKFFNFTNLLLNFNEL